MIKPIVSCVEICSNCLKSNKVRLHGSFAHIQPKDILYIDPRPKCERCRFEISRDRS